MTTSAVGNAAADFILQETKRQPNNEMGKDQFMKLLLAQMQNQDPTEPMDNSQMMAQMAQFSALEAMQNMSNATSNSQAYAMIGKGVVGFIRDETTGAINDVVGTVDSAGVEAGKPYVKVGNATVWLDNIQQVFDNSIIAGDSDALNAGSNLVGKYVRAEFPTENGSDYYEGLVQRLSVREGKVYLTVDGVEVGLYQVINVAARLAELGERPVVQTPEPEKAAEAAENDDIEVTYN